MNTFALYLSSRLTTVNSASMAGFVSAKLVARRSTEQPEHRAQRGHQPPAVAPIAAKPRMLTAGISASVTPAPASG